MKQQKFTHRTLSEMNNENLIAIISTEKLDREEAVAATRVIEKRFPSTMSTKEAAQYVGLSRKKVYRHVHDATIP